MEAVLLSSNLTARPLPTWSVLCAIAPSNQRGKEGQFALTLNIDFFNIEGNLQWNALTSTGIISCMCLNLPLDIQYKSENMYLAGIIPGPLEPLGDQLNHFLDPVINNLVQSWESRIHFSRTALHTHRQVMHSAIACLVYDLPAVRKAAQLAGLTSHFYCTACHCWHRLTCGRIDVCSADWVLHDKDKMCHLAELWKNAGTSTERNKLFASHRVQWLTLWRLPYWGPSCQVVIDTMHCLLEGLAHDHFHEFLGLTADSVQQKSDPLPAFHHPFSNIDLNKPGLTPQVEHTSLSSLRSVPYNFGEAKAGTLEADEWHTLATVYLPIVLVSLWGKGSQHHTSEVAANHRTILNHTMSLVSTVHIAGLPFMTVARAQAYHGYIVAWIRDLQVLHPHAPHCTNGHMVLHVWDYLQLFSPVRSWWCFPYEHLIGQMQYLPTNHIFGNF
ncbi:hypothetical protein BDR06DRAFT_982901 [Suillus hirtellus]|nr:hypothetical protein BDR06DRAFT_982901 [Suillus hirtellus]